MSRDKHKAHIDELQRLNKPIKFEMIEQIEDLKRRYTAEMRGDVPTAILVDRDTYEDLAYTLFRYIDHATLGDDPYRPSRILGMDILVDYLYRGKLLRPLSSPRSPESMRESTKRIAENALLRMRRLEPNMPPADMYYPLRYITEEDMAEKYLTAMITYCEKVGRKPRKEAEDIVLTNIGYYAEQFKQEDRERVLRLFKPTPYEISVVLSEAKKR